MPMYIALLRAINVGGRNRLSMGDLVNVLESLGFDAVQTYIQSGNVVFRTTRRSTMTIAHSIAAAIEADCGFRPKVLVLTLGQLRAIAKANPYPKAADKPTSLQVFILQERATAADCSAMQQLASATEDFTLTDAALYLHAPDGIGRSKLAAQAERHLGVSATARNWRTITALLAMAGNSQP